MVDKQSDFEKQLLPFNDTSSDIKPEEVDAEIEYRTQKIDEIAASIEEGQKELGRSLYTLGKIKELKLEDAEAYENFKQAVNYCPENIEFLNAAGLSGTRVGDYEQAEQFLNKALKLSIEKFGKEHPDTVTAYNNLALNLDAQGKFDEAKMLRQCIPSNTQSNEI